MHGFCIVACFQVSQVFGMDGAPMRPKGAKREQKSENGKDSGLQRLDPATLSRRYVLVTMISDVVMSLQIRENCQL